MHRRLNDRSTTPGRNLLLSAVGFAFLALTTLPARALGQQDTPMAPSPQQADGGAAASTSDSPVPNHGVYHWQDVPKGQQVSVERASFDQGGFQIYSKAGATIVVPFDENLNAMKLGRSDTGRTYFVNDGSSPILYLSSDAFLENAMEQNSRWYPITRDFDNSSPVYVDLAPSWDDFLAMGWYPGMVVYGGTWTAGLNAPFTQMPGFFIRIYGVTYRSFFAYRTYTLRHPSVVQTQPVYTNYGTRATRAWNIRPRPGVPVNGNPRSLPLGTLVVRSGNAPHPPSESVGSGGTRGVILGRGSVGTFHSSQPTGTMRQPLSPRRPSGTARNGRSAGNMRGHSTRPGRRRP